MEEGRKEGWKERKKKERKEVEHVLFRADAKVAKYGGKVPCWCMIIFFFR